MSESQPTRMVQELIEEVAAQSLQISALRAELEQVKQERDGALQILGEHTGMWPYLRQQPPMPLPDFVVNVKKVLAAKDEALLSSEAAESENKRLREALEKIAEGDDCGCIDHNDEDCCNKSGVHCAVCIAAAALRGE